MGLGVMGLLLAAIASSPGWLWLAGRFGKYKVWSPLPAMCKLSVMPSCSMMSGTSIPASSP